MSTINNGGPAFPTGAVRKSRPAFDPGGNFVETDRVQPLHPGLTIRDYFAARAMQGFLTHEFGADAPSDKVAAWAYEMADAMLKARQLNSQQ